jgi:hypothetical protein
VNTAFLLMAQYNAQAIIPIDAVARDYFGLTKEQLVRKINAGDVRLPMVRMEPESQKAAKGVHLQDLAAYLDERAEAARRECRQLND